MACEDPYVFGYVVEDSLGTPILQQHIMRIILNFLKKIQYQICQEQFMKMILYCT